MLMAQARRTLSGLLKQGKDALRQQDPDEAVLAAKQVSHALPRRHALLPDASNRTPMKEEELLSCPTCT